MTWWIAGGIVVLAVLWLLIVLARVFGTLRRFGQAALTLNRRLTDGAQRLQPRLDELQVKAEAMQGSLLVAQERALVLQARREKSTDG